MLSKWEIGVFRQYPKPRQRVLNMTQAIFVGEETSGKPNHFGEIKLLELANSGLKIQYSTKYFKNSETDLKTITPDYTIEESFKDFIKGHDPVYDWVIKQ